MRARFIEIVHPDVEGVGLIHEDSLAGWEARGWKRKRASKAKPAQAPQSDVTAQVSLDQGGETAAAVEES